MDRPYAIGLLWREREFLAEPLDLAVELFVFRPGFYEDLVATDTGRASEKEDDKKAFHSGDQAAVNGCSRREG